MIFDQLRLNVNGRISWGSDDIVFLGCSFTAGYGLDNNNQCYGSLMASALNKQYSNIAVSGQNNATMFDQFSHMNLEPGASVVLQLTELSRITCWDSTKKSIKNIFLGQAGTREQIAVFSDEYLIYNLLRNLRFIVKLCRTQNVKLVIWSIIRTPGNDNWHIVEKALAEFPEYVYLESALNLANSYRVDNASDGTQVLGTGHPGPISHRLIANQLIKHYRMLYRD